MKNFVSNALKGFAMGAANVVPGVSGGTIALITGIYSRIVDCLASLTDRETWISLFRGKFGAFWKKIDGGFVLALGIGIVASIFTLAKLFTWLLENYAVYTWAFFFGMIAVSAVFMLKDNGVGKPADALTLIAGLAAGVAVSALSPTQTPDALWFIFICAALAVCTMILPGISGSFILVILGKYDFVMQAVADLNLPVLAVFALGCVIGLLAFARLLKVLLARFEKQTMLVLVGFVIGSLVKVWPWQDGGISLGGIGLAAPSSAAEILIATICALAGVLIVVFLEKAGKKAE